MFLVSFDFFFMVYWCFVMELGLCLSFLFSKVVLCDWEQSSRKKGFQVVRIDGKHVFVATRWFRLGCQMLDGLDRTVASGYLSVQTLLLWLLR